MRLKILIIIIALSVILAACTVQKPAEKSEITVAEETKAVETVEPAPEIKCNNDNDCGGRVVMQRNCFQGNVQGTATENRCVNPGRTNSYCTSEIKTGVLEECQKEQFCRQGECRNYENCQDSDGGINFTVKGEVLQDDGSVFEDYCKDGSHIKEYYCASDNRAFSKEEVCDCSKGACEAGRNY